MPVKMGRANDGRLLMVFEADEVEIKPSRKSLKMKFLSLLFL